MPLSNVQDGQMSERGWPLFMPYVAPVFAASVAIVPAFRDLIWKSELQKGELISRVTFWEGMKKGYKKSPTVAVLVGTQMVLQNGVEKVFAGEEDQTSLSSMLASSAVVGAASSPLVAIFNGQTMGWSVRESLRKFSGKQGFAVIMQETSFVGGLSAADRLGNVMKSYFGDNKAVEYTAAFLSGALGSLAGHPANTALTRWQIGMTVDFPGQLMWGAARKARAIGTFAVVYKWGTEALGLEKSS